jgi:hypothetical protein
MGMGWVEVFWEEVWEWVEEFGRGAPLTNHNSAEEPHGSRRFGEPFDLREID